MAKYQAKEGDRQAMKQLVEWTEKYEGKGNDVNSLDADSEDNACYQGLPAPTAELLRQLDLGLAEVIHRGELGLTLDPIEQLIYETAQTVRAGGARSVKLQRLELATVPVLEELKCRHANNMTDSNQAKPNDGEYRNEQEKEHDIGPAKLGGERDGAGGPGGEISSGETRAAVGGDAGPTAVADGGAATDDGPRRKDHRDPEADRAIVRSR